MKLFDIKGVIKGYVDEAKDLGQSYIDLLKVRGIKKASLIGTHLIIAILIGIIVITAIIFLSIALALYIGHLLNSYALGFLIFGAVSILLLIVLLIFKKRIFAKILDFMVSILTKEE